MPRPRLAAVAAVPLVVFAATAHAANVALPSQNPLVRTAGTTTFGNVGATGFLNDGVDGATTGASIFQVPGPGIPGIPGGSRGFGYDLGAAALVESLNLSQFTGESPLGPRARLADVIVHTAAGSFPFSLPDQDDNTLTLPAPVVTNWVVIEPVSQHAGGDPQVGIDELAVNGNVVTSPLPLRTNVALNRPATRQGPNWNNVNGNLTDGVLSAANTDLSTSMFNGTPTASDVSIDLDLGQSYLVSSLGLAENDYGGAGGRTLISNATLEFSEDPSFVTVTATRALSLANIPYQQVDFDPATGQYVRLTFQGVYPGNDANLGFTEVQLFTVVPEPGALGLLALGLLTALRRRRCTTVDPSGRQTIRRRAAV